MDIGMSKHRKSGHSVNNLHFTGLRGSDSVRKRKSTRKQRKLRQNTHVSKFS